MKSSGVIIGQAAFLTDSGMIEYIFPLVCHITASASLFPSINIRDLIHFLQGSHACVHTYLYVKFPFGGLEISLSGR
jgi:hypothetical protein